MKVDIFSKSYTIRDDNGVWLGQIVLTSDGMFASVTEYGNLSYAWRRIGDEDFRSFLCTLDVDYFGNKMRQGLSYIAHSRDAEKACKNFAQKILPPLQKILKEELQRNTPWINQ